MSSVIQLRPFCPAAWSRVSQSAPRCYYLILILYKCPHGVEQGVMGGWQENKGLFLDVSGPLGESSWCVGYSHYNNLQGVAMEDLLTDGLACKWMDLCLTWVNLRTEGHQRCWGPPPRPLGASSRGHPHLPSYGLNHTPTPGVGGRHTGTHSLSSCSHRAPPP